MKESGGEGVTVSDMEIVKAMRELGRDGIFCEPASATTLAALKKINYEKDEKIVLIITGHGLKDPNILLNHI